MGLLETDAFLSELNRIYLSAKSANSVSVTMKRYLGPGVAKAIQKKPHITRKPNPRAIGPAAEAAKKKAAQNKGKAVTPEEPLCLVRASNGKRKISTLLSTKDIVRFQIAYAGVVKSQMDALKKRSKNAPAASTRGKSKA